MLAFTGYFQAGIDDMWFLPQRQNKTDFPKNPRDSY